MNPRICAMTGSIFVAQALFFSLLSLMLTPALEKWERITRDDLFLGCTILAGAGLLLSFPGRKHPAGKAGILLGVPLIMLLLIF